MRIDTRIQASLWFLVVSGALVGVWALFFPQAFYDSFPGMGRSWISVDGPFNEHLIRDVGGGYLSLTVVALVAVCIKTRELALAAALGWLVAQIPHFSYHMYHLGMYPAAIDKVGNVVSLALLVLVPAYILGQTIRRGSR
jgi:hypothetical protein